MNLDAKVTGFKQSDYNILFIVCQSCFSEKKRIERIVHRLKNM